MDSIEIRAIKVEELGRLCKLIHDLHDYQSMEHVNRMPSEEEIRQELSHKVENSDKLKANNMCTYPIVAVDKTRLNEPNHDYIIGYMIYTHSFSIIHGRCLFLTSFFIEENYRRKGIGKKIMEYIHLQALVLKAKHFDVSYMNNNYKGLNFYRSFGAYSCNKDYEMMIMKVQKLDQASDV